MKRVELHVKALPGEKETFVAAVAIPPFQTMPEVITWGTRTFLRETDEKYVECFAVAAVMDWPKEPAG